MANIIIGKIVPVFKGDYSATTTYTNLDVVKYNGSSYVCIASSSTNVVPTNTTNWVIVAEKGDKGEESIGKVDYSEIDKFGSQWLAIFQGLIPTTYEVRKGNYLVGLLYMFMDWSNHVVTQYFITNYSDINDGDSHKDGAVFQYYRSYNISSPYFESEKGTWSDWKQLNKTLTTENVTDEETGKNLKSILKDIEYYVGIYKNNMLAYSKYYNNTNYRDF